MARQPPVLIDRVRELAMLGEVLAAAGSGEPSAAVVAGDAGVGKSRLVGALAERARADGVRVLVGHCVNLPDAPPYLPFVDAFRGLDCPAWTRLEPHLRGGATQTLGQLQLYEATVELLAEMAELNPVCLILEDLHWADRPSRDLLRYLLGRLDGERLALVLTFRSDDLHRRHPLRPFLADIARLPMVRRVAVEPLPASAIELLLGAAGPIDRELLADIVTRAEGNPFFAEELLEARRLPGSRGALPEALMDVLIARLEQLEPGASRVVGVAAVAGRRVGHDILAAVTGLPAADLDDALREATARHVLVTTPDGDAYQFRHALLQEAAYADLLPGERIRLHGCYAQALQQLLAATPALAGELAHHAQASHDIPLALHASVLAAGYARAVHAPSEAQRHLERALSFWSLVPDAAQVANAGEVELHLCAAEASLAAGDPPRAVSLLEAAARKVMGAPGAGESAAGSDGGQVGTMVAFSDVVAGSDGGEAVGLVGFGGAHTSAGRPVADRELAVLVHARLAMALFQIGGDSRAIGISARAVELSDGLGASRVRAEALSAHAYARFVTDAGGAEVAAQEALEVAAQACAPALQAEALVTLSRISERAGDPDTATTYLTRALELARSSGDVAAELRALFNLAMSRYDAGDLPATLEWTGRTRERAMAAGASWSAYAREARGIGVIARYVSGDWDVSEADAARGVAKAPVRGRPLIEAFGLHVAVGRGSPDVADRLAKLRASRHPDPFEDAQIGFLIGGCEVDHLTWQGEPAAAVQAYWKAIEYPTRWWGEHYLGRIWLDALALAAMADQAESTRLRGDADSVAGLVAEGERVIGDARETARRGEPRGGRLGAEGSAWLARAEAEWSRLHGENDPSLWRAALAAFSYGYTYEIARCRWRLAGALLAAGDAAEAPELLLRAHADATTLQAAPLAEAIVALARRARIAGIGAAQSVSLLTAREHEVLTLLAAGRTNRQVGKELYISEKTASVHVSNILGKLGAANRGEAVSIAQRRGLI